MTLPLPPRVVIAATASGVGKTTVATGLLAALARRGVPIAAAKVGPDFIDPGYHSLATGRPGRNLDRWISGASAIGPLAGRAAASAERLVVEGVMGLFDGAAERPPAGELPIGSTAEIAHLLDAPVVLVVDASALSGSVAAIVHGFATFDARVRVAGVILNRVGSDGHETMLREALEPLGLPVLGALRRDDALVWRDRHLGLVPVVEKQTEIGAALDRLAAAVADRCDLDALVRVAATATRRDVGPVDLPSRVADRRVRVAVAGGRAFSFTYADNVEAFESAGAEIVPFDPCTDRILPEAIDAVVAGGGFPEVYARELAANAPLLRDVRERVDRGVVVWAECGGLLWLAEALDGHRLAGVVPATARMTDRLTLGYRTATTRADSPLGPAGVALRGHEFHYSELSPPGEALDLEGRFGRGRAGYASPTLLASYLHVHLGAAPHLAESFVRSAATRSPRGPGS